MYKNKFKNRFSIRHSGSGNGFSRPFRKNNFNNRSRFSSNRGSGGPRRSKLEGADINIFISKVQDSQAPQIAEQPLKTFNDLNLAPILKSNISNKGYTSLTPIQDQSIQPILEGRDLIGLAATGTGKTAAFLIPLIQKMYSDRTQATLIITPTRELAIQIQEEFRDFSQGMGLQSAALIGGTNIQRQIRELRTHPCAVIATPGRLRDLIERKAIYLEDYSNIVLDEVDLMVDIGFINDVKYFVYLLPPERQSLFFSATISPKIQGILQDFVRNPVTVSVKVENTPKNIDQDVIKVEHPSKKIDQLHDLLNKDGFDKVLIFGKTKHGIERLNRELNFRGFKTGALHGNKNQSQRRRVLESFKQNEIQILLATDVASRGLDIDNVTHVINYDLPQTYDDYIHRIGRTGRVGKTGVALTFVE